MTTNFNKRKIINDPVYGFIHIPFNLVFDLIEHQYFQRLRRISQLGLSNLVYPGAHHTRFHHALGAMHLMVEALEVIQDKGCEISEAEFKGAVVAILLHDIGHGPYSHTLEKTLVSEVPHERISSLLMEKLNEEFSGELTVAIEIFNGTYPRKFLHQLVSSQLDMDRLDYLKRDSFFTGVSEGVISSKRIIKMLNVCNNELVLEEKGVYSIEKFIVARRLMYWQVYMHKTVVAAEFMLVNLMRRAQELAQNGEKLFCTPPLERFLYNKVSIEEFYNNKQVLEDFAQLDDHDITTSIKMWQYHEDFVLSTLSTSLLSRKLFKVIVKMHPAGQSELEEIRKRVAKKFKISTLEAEYFVIHEMMENQAYSVKKGQIKLMLKSGEMTHLEELADYLNLPVLTEPVKKYFVSYPKDFV